MNVTCPECRSVYRVDPAKVVGARVRARCSVCGGIIPVSDQVSWGEDFPEARLGSPGDIPRDPTPPTVAASVETGSGGATRVPLFTPRRPSPGPSVAAPSFPASTIRPPTPSFTPATPASRTPAPVVAARVSPPVAPAPEPRGVSQVAAATPVATVPVVRKPINPFLANDPNQKARRLARALVSDMTAYHPQKRSEGERNGTLKQLFREEIKKSYEEYVEQVGREFAEATTHFQDALNEILASGKRLF